MNEPEGANSALPPKASSVTVEGKPDGWVAPRSWRAQQAPDGSTRLVVSVPSHELEATHLALLSPLEAPWSVRYLKLTDRQSGQLPKPETWVRMDVRPDTVRDAMAAARRLIWHDGRHQLWIRGRMGDQVVLDELGVLYAYPDDPAFQAALADLPRSDAVGMDGRDYVRVELLAEADAEERAFIHALSLQPWKG